MISAAVAEAQKTNNVAATSLAYDEMAKDWQVVTDFLGSTRSLRDLGPRWLPRMKKEKSENYLRRLSTSYLYPMFRDTVDKIVARPFSRDIQIKGDLPARLEPMLANADGRGSSLTQFTRAVFRDAIAYGKSHILVEFPAGGAGETEQDQVRAGKVPFLTFIPAAQLIAWNDHVDDAGRRVLDEIRFAEQEVVPFGAYAQRVMEVIWLLRGDGSWEKWWRRLTNSNRGTYTIAESGVRSVPQIQLVTIYTHYLDHLVARPPLLDLAWTNAAHLQFLSRQNDHEQFLRTPIFMRSGWTQEEIEKGVDLGASEGIGSTSAEAKAAWIESTGQAAAIGRAGIRATEEHAETQGLQHMATRTGDVRATAIAVDEAKTINNIQAWIRAMERGLEQAFGFAAELVRQPLPEDLRVDIWSDFPLDARAGTDIPQLLELYRAGALPLRELLAGVRLRGLLPPEADIEAIAQQVESRGPPLSLVGLGGPFDGAGSSNGAGSFAGRP